MGIDAEWGFAEPLGADVDRMARRLGARVRRIVFREPEDLSPLVADLYRSWYEERGLPADRLLVESFFLLDPWWALRTGCVPFWMKFNMEASAEALERYLDRAGPFAEIHLMLFSHGTESIGLAPIERWRALAARATRHGRLAGIYERAFPRDFGVFARYHDALREIPSRFPIPAPLSLAAVERLCGEARRQGGLHMFAG